MVIFLYKLYVFVCVQHGCLPNTVFTLDLSNSVIKRLSCMISWRNKKKISFFLMNNMTDMELCCSERQYMQWSTHIPYST